MLHYLSNALKQQDDAQTILMNEFIIWKTFLLWIEEIPHIYESSVQNKFFNDVKW